MTKHSAPRRPFTDLPRSQQAGILCHTDLFQTFVALQMGIEAADNSKPRVTSTACAEHIRRTCGIDTRKELNTNRPAQDKFDALRTEFDAWRGAIPKQR
ncbi:hypothetical protein [Shimia ponticola]|uniref:hypothetical protein n=1 Tax=Shimia ponticola TaxID=2582893 RepID=UPI0011BF4B32|nr:hypothetical protein [Shimia ponticola]